MPLTETTPLSTRSTAIADGTSTAWPDATVQVLDIDGSPRTLDWLRQTYQCDILDAGDGDKFKLERVQIAEGPTVIFTYAGDEAGLPIGGQWFANHYPGVEDDEYAVDLAAGGVKSLWFRKALTHQTNAAGYYEWGYGADSIIRAGGGPHTLWVASPSLRSDALTRVGWLGGTNHRGPTRLYFRKIEGVVPDPPPDPPPDPGTTEELLGAILAATLALNAHLGV